MRDQRFFVLYVDDSGNEHVGTIWTALAFPAEYWTSYLRSWLNFRKWLYNQHEIPASFELHSLDWLSLKPLDRYEAQAISDLRAAVGHLPAVLADGREARKIRSQIFEKALKTVGSFQNVRVLTVFTQDPSGPSKIALYDDLLCFAEEFLERERGFGTLMVDGVHDSGRHMRSAHRALISSKRRILEDAGHRSSSDSQFLQMADMCAHAAYQSIAANEARDSRFVALYQTALAGVIERQFEGDQEGRCVRGCDYHVAPHEDCPSENIVARLAGS